LGLLSRSVEDGAHVTAGVVFPDIFKLQDPVERIQRGIISSSSPNDLRGWKSTGATRDEKVVPQLNVVPFFRLKEQTNRIKQGIF
jgi:hypothetical protein